MNFPLSIRNIGGAKRLVIGIISQQPRSFGSFEAFIDTGSARTILSAKDAIKLGICFSSYQQSNPLSGFGKGSMPTIIIPKFALVIRSTNGATKKLIIPLTIPDVPKIKKMDQNTYTHAMQIPSLIGLDFLESNNLRFYVDINKNVAYLED